MRFIRSSTFYYGHCLEVIKMFHDFLKIFIKKIFNKLHFL